MAGGVRFARRCRAPTWELPPAVAPTTAAPGTRSRLLWKLARSQCRASEPVRRALGRVDRLASTTRRWWTSSWMLPVPIVPDYAGANVRGIVPALLGPAPWSTSMPAWMPTEISHARQVVLLVIDGLGWDQLEQRRHIAPTLAGLSGGRITTVAPTTTA